MDKQPETSRPSTAPRRSVVLASTSRYRRQLIERLRIPFEAIDPGLDEEPYQQMGLEPVEMVRQLAAAKARAVLSCRPEAIVIGRSVRHA